jgi:hypothetical protein
MAARERAAHAGETLKSLRGNPSVQRFIQDAEVRQNIREAYGLSRDAYGRMSNGKPAMQALLEDKKLQNELRGAALLLGASAAALREGPAKPKKKRHLGRKLLILVAGAALALALSEGLRKTVLDALFGAEEEFDYTSTTVATPSPDPVGAA